MKFFEVITVSGADYQLKISTANAVQLETELGTDLLSGLENIGKIEVLAKYYFAALKCRNDSIKSIDDVYALFDDYMLDAHTFEDLQHLIIEVLVVSGIMTKEAHDLSKKMQEKQREALQKLSE